MDKEKSTLHSVEGGGTRSEKAPAHHLNPMYGAQRTSLRFALGAKIHGPNNWKRSCDTEEHAFMWCCEAYNHMMEHIRKMREGEDPQDDHIGAIGWAVEIFAYVEHRYKMPWIHLGEKIEEAKPEEGRRR